MAFDCLLLSEKEDLRDRPVRMRRHILAWLLAGLVLPARRLAETGSRRGSRWSRRATRGSWRRTRRPSTSRGARSNGSRSSNLSTA